MEHVIASNNPPQDKGQEQHPPFLLRVEHLDVDKRGAFRPAASVRFAAQLRTSGLLAAMPPEAVRDLLMLLTFITPNGVCAPQIDQLAEAMGVPVAKARHRFERLSDVRFQGQKLVVGSQRANGSESYSPLPWLAPVREDASPNRSNEAQPVLYAAPRQVVIDHSRATYARPRAEVEREIERQLGHSRPHNASDLKVGDTSQLENQPIRESESAPSESDEIIRLLIGVGLLREQAETLLERHDLLSIRRQLAWLPHRGAKNPAGFLMAAVKDNYEAPPSLRPPSAPSQESTDNNHLPSLDTDLEVKLELPESTD